MSKLSIVVRSRENEDITETVNSIKFSSGYSSEVEIIVVSYSTITSDICEEGVHYVKCSAKRIEAKVIGVKLSHSDKILFLDSDQTISNDLINEAIGFNHDFGFIPERSSNRHFMAKLMDSKRIKTESLIKKNLNIHIPVVPRLFRKYYIERALSNLGSIIIKNVTETEDSIIFYELLNLTQDSGWLSSFIYNFDPNLREYVRKSFRYGMKNEMGVVYGYLPPEYVSLIRRIQIETLINNRSYDMKMFLCNIIRGIPYMAGTIKSLLKR